MRSSHAPPEENPIHVFDLDHTLITVNSSFHFGKYLYRRKDMSFMDVLFCNYWYAIYQGFCLFPEGKLVSVNSIYDKMYKRLFGKFNMVYLNDIAKEFVEKEIPAFINQEIFDAMTEAKESGEKTILLSSSPHFLVQVIGEKFGFYTARGTKLRVDTHKNCTGVEEVMTGQEKADFIQHFAEEHGETLEDIKAYSDSHHDIPLLEIVGKPIVVKPDKILRRKALEKHWTIY